MSEQQIIEDLAWKMFDETNPIWSAEEKLKAWTDPNHIYKEHYTWLAQIAFRHFQSIYYSF